MRSFGERRNFPARSPRTSSPAASTSVYGRRQGCAQREIRRAFPCELRDAEVLHERGIRAGAFEELQIRAHVIEFFVKHHRVDGHVDVHAAQMREADGFREPRFIKIIRIGARAKVIARQIDRIRAGLDRCDECFPASCRRQKFDQWKFLRILYIAFPILARDARECKTADVRYRKEKWKSCRN